MSTTAPASQAPPAMEDSAVPRPPRWRRWLEHPWLRTALGLLVLGAIVGGLAVIDRIGGDDLGPLDGRTPKVGELAPQFALPDPDGKVHRLSDYRGQVVWINFWASWCDPCRRELPDVQRLANEFRDQDLVVLAVNVEEPAGKALSFWEELDLDLPLLLDSDGDVAEQYQRVFPLQGLPDHFFVDRGGMLQALQSGFLTERQMREKLAQVGLE